MCIRGQLYAFHQIDSLVSAGLVLNLLFLSLSLLLFLYITSLIQDWLLDESLNDDWFVFYNSSAKHGGFLYQQVADGFNSLGQAHYRSSSGDLLVLLLFGFMVPMKMGGLLNQVSMATDL